ncbi:MAG: hypothetical protein AAF750_00885 [Planctomycetota bacterium]
MHPLTRPRLLRGLLIVSSVLAWPMASQAQTEVRLTEPEPIEGVTPSNSRFGLNVSSTDHLALHQQLGIGWVRFENAKWPFVSPARGVYAFDGSVAPWNVDVDHIIGSYHDAGFGVLPMLFQTPRWAVHESASAAEKSERDSPPHDPNDYQQFCFQFAARYGGRSVPTAELMSADQATGKGAVKYYEIWNEPNLNPKRSDKPPTWGPWRATMEDFWPFFRAGAEGVKAAYPDAIVTSPGFAGMTPEVVDSLRTYTYPDGKRPIDFCDVINVHFYSGKYPPETAGKDPNSGDELGVRYEEHVRRLTEWRDTHRPEAEIWLTETGHDTGGPIGISEAMQAARLPRNLMIGIHNGIDKIFIYREKGSTPSKHAAAGLLRNDNSRKPAWYTVATLIRQLHGAEPAHQLLVENDNIRLYTWTRGGQTLLTAWTIEGTEPLGLELGSVAVTDAFGHTTRLDNTADLILDDFPRYLTDIAEPAALAPLVEAARTRSAQRRAALDALAAQEVYLFDLGAGIEPVSRHVGRMRVYDKVSASLPYDPQRGFGFEGQGRENGFQHWFRPLKEKHFAVVPGGVAFRFDAKPGTYELSFLAEASRKPQRKLTLTGGAKPVEVALTTKNRDAHSVRITTTGDPIRVLGDGEFILRWVEAVPISK